MSSILTISKKKLLHIGIHNSANKNAGDTLLFCVVRHVFDKVLGPFDWELWQVWNELTVKQIQRFNEEYDGIVVGGGGLLLSDQDGCDTSNSGWQWNISVEAVKAISIPLVIFGIGYNRFRGQVEFAPIFKTHIQEVIADASFFGLRNSGSIKAVTTYLTGNLQVKLSRQFCPTTLLWQLYPQYRAMAEQHDAKKYRILAFNAAFDRTQYRFGNNINETLTKIAQAIKLAQNRGWSIVVVAHKAMDREIELYLDSENVSYKAVDLTNASPDEVMSFYAQIDIACGMRGHAQMIPFGLRRPIMSIISHDKVRYFLEDIDRLEWGIEVNSPMFAEFLITFLEKIERKRERIHNDIAKTQSILWEETLRNFEYIGREILNKEPCILSK